MAGVDNVSVALNSGADLLSASVGSGSDRLGVAIGSGLDGLTKSSVGDIDNMSAVYGTLVTDAGMLTQDDSDIQVVSTSSFPAVGSAKIIQPGGVTQIFFYTGKTATALTGCSADTDEFDFNIDDKSEIQ